MEYMLKSVYAIQPFQSGGGNKEHKSLGLILPRAVVHELRMTRETILALRVNVQTKSIILEKLSTSGEVAVA